VSKYCVFKIFCPCFGEVKVPEKIFGNEILISDCPYVNIAPLCPSSGVPDYDQNSQRISWESKSGTEKPIPFDGVPFYFEYFELKSEVSFGTSKLRHFFKIQKQNSSLFAAERFKQSELIGKPSLNPNHCSIPMEKVLFSQIFTRKQTFDRIVFTLRNSP
jgi:hypothetical protein